MATAHTVSLADLAAAAGTSAADLAAGLQQSDDAVAEVSGVVARASSPVAFDFTQATPLKRDDVRVRFDDQQARLAITTVLP